MSNSEFPLVLVGRGRIGGAVASELALAGTDYVQARLNPSHGLQFEAVDIPAPGAQQPLRIDKILVCVASSRHSPLPPDEQWHSLFEGLLQQVLQQQVKINQLLFVSSSRVYEGITNGLITADSVIRPLSARGRAIVQAEVQAAKCCSQLTLIRCGGLYGADYQHYLPIMQAASDRPRCGTSQKQLINKLLAWCLQDDCQAGTYLFTDGMVYWQGEAYPADQFCSGFPQLVEQWPLLIHSFAKASVQTERQQGK